MDVDRLAVARATLAAHPAAMTQPVAMAADKLLPVLDPLVPLLPREGLVRGHVVGCQGAAAMSLALALAAGPTAAGSWAAVIGLPSVGVQAAVELGLAVERTMFVASAPSDQWAVVLGAAIDGADVVIASCPQSATLGAETRRLQSRLQSRGAVLMVVGDPGSFVPDIVLRSDVIGWEGIGDGHGHLTSRRVAIEVSGRRAGRPRRCDLLLPGPGGAPAAVHDASADVTTVAPPTVAPSTVHRQDGWRDAG